MGLIRCPETSVRTYHYTLHKIQKFADLKKDICTSIVYGIVGLLSYTGTLMSIFVIELGF